MSRFTAGRLVLFYTGLRNIPVSTGWPRKPAAGLTGS
jgi:hypothetical protein